jgi:hypothetical protein
MFTIPVPGEIWEVEFLDSGEVEIEIFRSDGIMRGREMLEVLFSDRYPSEGDGV